MGYVMYVMMLLPKGNSTQTDDAAVSEDTPAYSKEWECSTQKHCKPPSEFGAEFHSSYRAAFDLLVEQFRAGIGQM